MCWRGVRVQVISRGVGSGAAIIIVVGSKRLLQDGTVGAAAALGYALTAMWGNTGVVRARRGHLDAARLPKEVEVVERLQRRTSRIDWGWNDFRLRFPD